MSIRIAGFVVGAVAVSADQATKMAATRMITLNESISVLPFFNFVHLRNEGVSFGLISSAHPWVLSILALTVITILVIWLWRTDVFQIACGLGMIIGGALGNLLDRLQRGAVTDFLDFHIGGFHWPAFNIADAAIVSGVIWLVACDFFMRRAGASNR